MKLLKEIRSWVGTIGMAVLLTLFIGIFIFEPYKVEGHSMDPSLHDQERIYVSKLSHTFSKLPGYGDIVVIDSRTDRTRTFLDDVLEHPLIQLFTGTADDRVFYVKRVIGKPGDVIKLDGGKLYRNGAPLDEPYIKEAMDKAPEQEWTVPADHIFVMGDNRNNSNDSRSIGFIPLGHVMGIKKLP